jgi:hypothetical protein
MDRATKLIVFTATAIALVAQAWFASRGWSALLPITIGLSAGAAIAAALDRRTIAASLVCAYVFPALINVGHGLYLVEYDVLWMAPLFAAMTPDGIRTPWRIPTRWRGALISWALVVTVGVPIVAWREIDFNRAIHSPMPYAALSSGATVGVSWILHVGLILLLGILWFDWLFSVSETDFMNAVVAPLAVSALILTAASAYQMLSDVSFLNQTAFGALKRATGTLYDANVAGAVAAMWVGGTVLATSWLRLLRWPAVMLGVVMAWIAIWGSGSRNALVAGVIASIFNLTAFYAAERHARARSAVRRLVFASAAALALLVVLVRADVLTTSPIERVLTMVSAPSVGSVRTLLSELWNRNGYGTVANAMIRRFPLVGVGVGSFHSFVSGFVPGKPLPPDNAQNWYRHQLAEFGLIGSLGWMVWVVAFGSFVLRRETAAPRVWSGRGILVALALISFVGMPTQHVVATFTFWTAAFWYTSIVGVPASRPLGQWAWLLVLAVPIAYGIGTANLGASQLSVPGRLEYMGPPHSFGFYWPESDGSGGQFRWAKRVAAAIVDLPTSWMILTVRVNHFDISSRPVDAYVWCDGVPVIKTHLQSTAPASARVHMPDGTKRVLIETWASRVIRPKDLGLADDREFGLMVDWQFVSGPQVGAVEVVPP